MQASVEESHEAGHALLAHLAGAEVLGALADTWEGKGYTRIKPLPADDDADRLIIAQALHIMAGVAGQRLAGYGQTHDGRGKHDEDELREWYREHEQRRIMGCFKSEATFQRYMLCTAEAVLAGEMEAFTSICSRLKSHGSINHDDLNLIGPSKKWLAPGHAEWWALFRERLRGNSDALERQRQIAEAVAEQQRLQEGYQRRLDELMARPRGDTPQSTYHRPRAESLMVGWGR